MKKELHFVIVKVHKNTKQKGVLLMNTLHKSDALFNTNLSISRKQIFEELEQLKEKKNTLMQEYSSSKSEMTELYKIRKNYENYMRKEMER